MPRVTNIPTIETERLILRPLCMDDWPGYLDLMRSSRARYMGGPYSVEAAWGCFCHDMALWALEGHGALAVDDRLTGGTVGEVVINAGPLFPERELGWLVYAEAEGKGYACEAAAALRDWAFAVRGLETLVSYIDPRNARSIKLAERLGAELDGDAPRQDPRDVVYRHPRS